jgi:hypothetical protein
VKEKYMNDEPHDLKQWPPAPKPVYGKNEQGGMRPKETKLLTGKAWADISLVIIVCLVLFSLLTLTFFNAWAASVLPSTDRFPSLIRLLLGWALASGVHFWAWRFLLSKHYVKAGKALGWTAIPTAVVWLLIILEALFLSAMHPF